MKILRFSYFSRIILLTLLYGISLEFISWIYNINMKSYFKFLSRNKAYTAIDVFGLAISMMFVVLIGCYTWQETHVDRQHTKADRMFWLGLNLYGKNTMGMHWHIQHLLKDKFPEIENSTAFYRNTRWLRYDGRDILTNCYFVDSTFYDIFDFKLIQGDPQTVLDNPSNIVVTPEFARKVWGDEDPMGKSIIYHYTEDQFIVAGVMEPMKNTVLMTNDRQPVDMLINFNMAKHANASLTDRGMGSVGDAEVLLLAKEGYDLSVREKEYEKGIKNNFWILNLPEDNIRLKVYPFRNNYFSGFDSQNINFGDIKMIRLLLGIGTLILLFAIMNYINLTVALAGKRTKEMATRRLLGERRMEIMWRLIGESAILCGFSMSLGIILAFLLAPYASILLNTPIDIKTCINLTTIVFLLVILLIMTLASGIIPAFLLSSMKPIEAVKGGIRKKSNLIFGKTFIVIQNVSTITMLACVLIMYLQVRHLIHAPLGYDYEGLMNLTYYKYGEEDDLKFKDEVLKLPFVENVSVCAGTPHSGGAGSTVQYNGHTVSYQILRGDTSYLDILGIKLEKDYKLSTNSKDYFNILALNAFNLDHDATDIPFPDHRVPIAGITEDFKIGNVLTAQEPTIISVGTPFKDFYPWSILVKIKGDEEEGLSQIKDLYEELYSNKYSDTVFEKPFVRQQIEEDFEYETRLITILTGFALVAIMISILGLTAMSTYYVRQNSFGIAVHKVMGGTGTEVLMRLVKTFMLYVLISAILSIPIIYYIMNDWLSQFSYRISIDWWIYASVSLLTIIICFSSVIIQCRKAANTNPINSLK